MSGARFGGWLRSLRAKRSGPGAQAGHVLLEWLIAAALGLSVLAGALTLYRGQRESFEQAADSARMIEAGATALLLVGQQIQMAGYAPADRSALRARVTPGVFGCRSARLVDGGAPVELGCLPDSDARANSDGIVVRYVDDAVATWRGASGEPTDCLGQAVARLGDHATIVNRFYVAQPPRRGEPELYCAGNGGARPPQPIVEGIDRLEIGYWLPGAKRPVRAGTVALAPTQWSAVVAVELCVVARGRRATGARGFVDCDGRHVPSHDGRQRLALRRRVVVRNRPEGAL